MENMVENVAAAPARPSFGAGFSAALRIFFAPRGVLEQVKGGLSWWPGLILLVILMAIAMAVYMPVQMEAMEAAMEAGTLPGLPPGADAEQAMGQMRTWTLVGGIAGPVLGVPIMLLLTTLFYWLALVISFGEARYGRLFALGVYTGFIGMAYQLINVIYMRAVRPEVSGPQDLQAAALNFSLSAFLPDLRGFLASFLAQISLFSIWSLVLYIWGAALITGRRRGAVAWPVVIVFVLMALLAGLFGSIGARFGS
jgi:hypothetical protein